MSIFETIKNLDDEEIDSFISDRLSSLKNTKEKEIGLNTRDFVYNGFLDEKVRVNIGCIVLSIKKYWVLQLCGVKFDDDEIYKELVMNVRDSDNSIKGIIKTLDEYLSLRDVKRDVYYDDMKEARACEYFSTDVVSIKQIRDNKLAMCAEISGVAHNMFKFMGIESDYVVIGGGNHSFNLVYPWGRENALLLFDGQRPSTSDPRIFLLGKEQKERLFSNEKVSVDEEDAIRAYLLGLNKDEKYTNSFVTFYSLREENYTEEMGYDFVPSSLEHKLIFRKAIKKEKD